MVLTFLFLGRVVGSGLGGVSSLVGGGGVRGVALVLHVGDEAVVVVGVIGDDLGAAVGEGDAVLAVDDAVLVLGLLLVEVGAGVVVVDAVLVGEGARGDLVGVVAVGGRVVRLRGTGGEGGGGAEDSEQGNELKQYKKVIDGEIFISILNLLLLLST